MIAISSKKPASPGSQYGKLQQLAQKSWQGLFAEVLWDDSSDVPPISHLAALGACRPTDEWVCLINSDIVLSNQFSALQPCLTALDGVAATSRRFEFDPAKGFPQRTTCVDLGFDIFVARPSVWIGVAGKCPLDFKLGKPQWDTWLHGYLNHYYRPHYYDFSKWGCVFHPRHERKPWLGTPLDIPWDIADLGTANELPKPR